MNTINKILVPIDLSSTSDHALRFTFGLFTNDYRPEIVAIHSCNVADTTTIQEKLETKIAEIKADFPCAKNNSVSIKMSSDVLIDTILKEQKGQQVDLIIMGTKGCDPKDDSVFSYTSELVVEADCPVLVVPETGIEKGVRKIALVLGKEEIDDPSVLLTLLLLARHFKAKVYVLTIVRGNGTYGYSEVDEKNENTVSYYLENFYSRHVFRESNDIEQGIFDFVEENGIDMVTILPANHAKKLTPSEGRLTKLLTLHTQIPLLALD